MKTFVHVLYQDLKEFYVRIPEWDDSEIIQLPISIVPKEVWKERSNLILARKRVDPVVRLYAKVNLLAVSQETLLISNWEVRQFTQEQIDEISSNIIDAMIYSAVIDAMHQIRKSLPDIPDLMLGISIMNSIGIVLGDN